MLRDVTTVMAALLIAVAPSVSQTPAQKPAFEVVSVKASRPSTAGTGRGSATACRTPSAIGPTESTATTTVYALVAWAYGLDCANAEAHGLLVGGANWGKSDLFEIQAVIPHGSTAYTWQQLRAGEAPQLQAMLQSMLATRFKLAVHPESRDISFYGLVVGKNGPRLRRFEEGSCDSEHTPSTLPQNSPKTLCSHMVGVARDKNGVLKLRVTANGTILVGFAQQLNLTLDRPVIDKTGFQGTFDITLESAIEGQPH